MCVVNTSVACVCAAILVLGCTSRDAPIVGPRSAHSAVSALLQPVDSGSAADRSDHPRAPDRRPARVAQAPPDGPPADAPEDPEAADQVFEIPLPVTLNQRVFGTVLVETSLTRVVRVSPGNLAQALADALTETLRQDLRARGDALVPVEDLAPLGVILRLDPATVTLVAEIRADLQRPQAMSFDPGMAFDGLERVHPSNFAAGVTGAFLVTDTLDDDEQDLEAAIALDGFMNLFGIRGLNVDFGGSFEVTPSTGATDVERSPTVAFVDLPDQPVRFSVGDVTPALPRLAGTYSALGASAERSFALLQPTRNVRPTGRRTFVLERRSTIEVFVNDVLVSRLTAGPGPVDLRDIPAAELSSNITIVVEDAFGREEIDAFTLANDTTLLADGLSEFSVAGGVLRDDAEEGVAYTDQATVSGFHARGVTENLTLTGYGALTETVVNAGASAAVAVPGGVTLLEAAYSLGDAEGFAAGFTYRGEQLVIDRDSLIVTADYFSEDYSQILDPASEDDIQIDFNLSYQFDVFRDYAIGTGGALLYTHGVNDPDAEVFLSASRSFGDFFVSVTGRHSVSATDEDEASVFLRVGWHLDDHHRVNASYNTLTDTGLLELRRQRDFGLPSFDYELEVERSPERAEVTGSAGVSTSRAEIAFDVDRIFEDDEDDRLLAEARLQSGIAIVDGRVGVGRDPGRGFYLVDRHPSLSDAQVQVQSGGGRTRGQTDFLGPAVVGITSPYRSERVQVVTENVPVGYDIGPGAYVLETGARSGIRITIGSDDFRTAIATLLVDGEPLELAFGRLTSLDDGTTKDFFTNRVGRTAFNQLGPGRYRADIIGTALAFEFSVREEDPAFVDLGAIQVERTP